MTSSGNFADTHGITGYEPKLTNSPFVVAWADTPNSYGWPDFVNSSLEEYTKRHSGRKRSQLSEYIGRATYLLAGARQAGFAGAAQEFEQAARHEAQVAVAQAAEMSGAGRRERKGSEVKQSKRGRLIKLYY